jgi:uncharacterized protein YxjI
MFCSKCGNQLSDNAKFCTKCGSPATQLKERAAEPPAAPVAPATPVAPAAPVAPAVPVADRGFFGNDDFVIDEKLSPFKFTNAYRVYNSGGEQIGAVEQQKVSGGAKAARLLMGSQVKGLQAFKLDIKDANGNTLATVSRGGVSGGIGAMRNIAITDSAGRALGAIKFSGFSLKPKLDILAPDGSVIGKIAGDWRGWNFTVSDMNGVPIGAVNKQWNGAMKELLTTADRYHVSISPQLPQLYRTAIISAAVTLDMVLHEVG